MRKIGEHAVPEILKILFNEALIHRSQSVEHIPTKVEMASRTLLVFLLHVVVIAVFTSLLFSPKLFQ